MTEILSATAARNYIGGGWSESAGGETYEKHNPWRPVRGDGRVRGLDRRRRGAAVDAARDGIPRLGGPARSGARRVLLQGGRRDRGARGADRTGHDGRDGQAAARGAHGGGARRGDPALLGRRGVPAGGRGLRAVGREPDALHAPPAARRRRADHAVELPGRDPGLEARAGADLRQHGRPQARLRGAAHRPPHRRVLRRGRAAGRRAQRAHRRRLEGRRRARLEPRTSARSRSPARSPSAAPCATRRRPATAACSSSSAATTRSS